MLKLLFHMAATKSLTLREMTELNDMDFAYSHYELLNTEIDNASENILTRPVNDCQYYSEDCYNCKFKNYDTFSVIHFNSRSLYANFDHIKSYLKQLSKPFSVILITETWMHNDREMDFSIEGYEFISLNRRNKHGGGVALFVDVNYGYKMIENMTMVMDDILECLTIEIERTKKKNIIVSCIYRTPGSNIDVFNEWIKEHFSHLNQKIMFVGGDFNIDLLNPNKHKKTDDYINTLFSIGLFPLITKPSRITSHSATLIDNIFSNEIESNIVSGLMINDISDHLPVFVLHKNEYQKNEEDTMFWFRRIKTEKSI